MKTTSMAVASLCLVMCATLFPVSARCALIEPHQPKMILHISTATSKGACSRFSTEAPNCSAIRTAAGLGTYFVFLVVSKGDSIPDLAAIQMGIIYDDGTPSAVSDGKGVDVFSWTLCADLDYSAGSDIMWPAPGSGNRILWEESTRCQTGPLAAAGYFYLSAYSPSTMSIIRDPRDNMALVADCRGVLAPPILHRSLGSASFSPGSVAKGCNPCLMPCAELVIPTKPTTWSALKALER